MNNSNISQSQAFEYVSNQKFSVNTGFKLCAKKRDGFLFGQTRRSDDLRIKKYGIHNKRKSNLKKLNNSSASIHLGDGGQNKTRCSQTIRTSGIHTKYKNSTLEELGKGRSSIDIPKQSLARKQEKKYCLEDFTVTSLLGFGTFGSVLLVENTNETVQYALKVVK